MNKPLSLVLIEKIFDHMDLNDVESDTVELDSLAFGTMRTLVLNYKHPFIIIPGDYVADMDAFKFKKDGMTLTFIEKK